MAEPTRYNPFEYTDRWDELREQFEPELSSELTRRLEKRDRDLEDFLCPCPAEGGATLDWWAARIDDSTSQTIGSGSYQKVTNWSAYQSGGEGATWDFTSGVLTLPAGVYALSAGGRFLSSSLTGHMGIHIAPTTAPYIGQEIAGVATGGATLALAGSLWSTIDETFPIQLNAYQGSGSNKEFGLNHFFVQKFAPLEPDPPT